MAVHPAALASGVQLDKFMRCRHANGILHSSYARGPGVHAYSRCADPHAPVNAVLLPRWRLRHRSGARSDGRERKSPRTQAPMPSSPPTGHCSSMLNYVIIKRVSYAKFSLPASNVHDMLTGCCMFTSWAGQAALLLRQDGLGIVTDDSVSQGLYVPQRHAW